jgi:hypothetical protein
VVLEVALGLKLRSASTLEREGWLLRNGCSWGLTLHGVAYNISILDKAVILIIMRPSLERRALPCWDGVVACVVDN